MCLSNKNVQDKQKDLCQSPPAPPACARERERKRISWLSEWVGRHTALVVLGEKVTAPILIECQMQKVHDPGTAPLMQGASERWEKRRAPAALASADTFNCLDESPAPADGAGQQPTCSRPRETPGGAARRTHGVRPNLLLAGERAAGAGNKAAGGLRDLPSKVKHSEDDTYLVRCRRTGVRCSRAQLRRAAVSLHPGARRHGVGESSALREYPGRSGSRDWAPAPERKASARLAAVCRRRRGCCCWRSPPALPVAAATLALAVVLAPPSQMERRLSVCRKSIGGGGAECGFRF